jgi:hypothetical protein
MRDDERNAFDAIIGEMYGAIDKPLSEVTREGLRKGLSGKMSLLDLARVRDLVLEDCERGERPNRFGLPEIWAAKRRLRAAAPPQSVEKPWTGDHWDERANTHLFGYVTRQGQLRCYYDEPATKILVAYKNNWARDMREGNLNKQTGEFEAPSVAEQKSAWLDCMARAEEAIKHKVAA